MNKLNTHFSVLSIFLLSALTVSAQTQDFKDGKSLETQYSIFRILKSNYVDTVDVGKLVNTGINSMLTTLDPYTVFIPEENEEEIDMMTTGSYGGVGSIIKKLPDGYILISEPYQNSPSAKSGLLPGDVIMSVNDTSTKDLTVSQCSEMMRGEPATEVKLSIKHIRTGEISDVFLKRERIHVSDVVYYGMIRDTIGYIQIGGFTLDGSKDVRKAIETMKSSGKLRRLILDLRSNGGGLMPEAIDIVSLFVPSGTLVVSSRGKGETMEYHTDKEPIDTKIPLMVLVNSGSASSSEIVAGALQDLDRAVIAGVRTFGKGLVQNIFPSGYGTSLKVTIAKYYTPSGRCVQAIDYSHRNDDGSVGNVPDSLKKEFKTISGRSVYDGGGITPDLVIEPKYFGRPIVSLIYSDIPSDWAITYFEKHNTIPSPSAFSLTDSEYDDFVNFAAEKEFDQRTESEITMEEVIEASKRDELYETFKNEIDTLYAKLTLTKKEFLVSGKDEIKPILEREICTKYYYRKGAAENSLRSDSQISKAIELWDTVKLK